MRATIIGGVAWNTMVYVDRFPEPHPQTLFPRGLRETVGSSGAGKALNLRALGAQADLWALVGDDEHGDRIREAMALAGVAFVAEIDPLGTARHVNLMDDDGERISMIANPGSLVYPVDTAPVVEMLADADIASVTIMDHCRAFLPIVRAAGVPLWVDIHDFDGRNPHHGEFIEAADALLLSTVAMDGWRAFAESAVASGTEVVLCTHGAEGASGLTADAGWVDVPAVPARRVIDTNGAGDAFFAGFVVATHAGADLASALVAATEHASRAVASADLAPAAL